jgi:hypothetical protein
MTCDAIACRSSLPLERKRRNPLEIFIVCNQDVVYSTSAAGRD